MRSSMKRSRENEQSMVEKKSRLSSSFDSTGSEGHWPSFICIPVKDSPAFNSLRRYCMDHFYRTFTIPDNVLPSLCDIPDIHISLSKDFSLRFHQINGFVEKLDYYLPPILHRFKVDISRRYSILFNENRRKGFICILLDNDTNDNMPSAISNLIRNVNKALLDFQQPVYYENPIIHISIASFEPTEEFLSLNSHVINTIHNLFPSPMSSPPVSNKDNSALDLLGQLYDSDERDDDSSDDVSAITRKDTTPVSNSKTTTVTEKLTPSMDIGEMVTVTCSSIHLMVGFQRCYEWPFHSSMATASTTTNTQDFNKSKRFILHSVAK